MLETVPISILYKYNNFVWHSHSFFDPKIVIKMDVNIVELSEDLLLQIFSYLGPWDIILFLNANKELFELYVSLREKYGSVIYFSARGERIEGNIGYLGNTPKLLSYGIEGEYLSIIKLALSIDNKLDRSLRYHRRLKDNYEIGKILYKSKYDTCSRIFFCYLR